MTIGGRSIGVFNVGGEFFALRNRCPHQGGALCEGQLWACWSQPRRVSTGTGRAAKLVACPWHGWEFHLRTGQSWCAPERLRVSRYEVALVAGAELPGDPEAPAPGMVKGPYVAETYPVAQAGAYLVVELPTGGSALP